MYEPVFYAYCPICQGDRAMFRRVEELILHAQTRTHRGRPLQGTCALCDDQTAYEDEADYIIAHFVPVHRQPEGSYM